MKILYDLQNDLQNAASGKFKKHGVISLRRDPDAIGKIEEIEDIKALLITARTGRESGIFIRLEEIEGLAAGDRITITGRVNGEHMLGSSWSVALLSVADGHLTHKIAPSDVFSLSYVLDKRDINADLTVHTVGWGLVQPLMDFYVDSILITRKEESDDFKTDTRKIIYSLAQDLHLDLIDTEEVEKFGNVLKLLRSGYPNVKIDKNKTVRVTTRVNDWDGLDILVSHMQLRAGNQYKISVRGRIDGDAPDGAIIMLQGVPCYSWRHNIEIRSNENFSLEYILSRSEVETWKAVRITTNPIAATMSFFVTHIEVERI